jgi:hypothetical protein
VAKIIQTEADLLQQLEHQVAFLQGSAESYDKGVRVEAKRLATHIRTLVHDTKRSTSLLLQLRMKDGGFLDSDAERPRGIISSYAGLVGIRVQPGPAEYVPSFGTWPVRSVPFTNWWNGVIIADLQRREITRRQLILAVANEDGGAHVAPELDEIYAALSRENSMGLAHFAEGTAPQTVQGVAFASVRQIAHEVLGTLDREQPVANVGTAVIHNPTITVHVSQLKWFNVRVGRNDPCLCGSGRKFKACCGR